MTTPTGSHATPKGSGRTPLPKAINQNVFDALKPYLINTHRAIVDGQGASGATVTTRSYGPCDAPTGIDAPTLIGYSTNVMMDGYTPPMPYEGGPARGDPIRTMETTPGNPLHLGIVTVLAHKLPFLSASTKFGKGLTEKDYGKYDVTTPDGVLHTAPGTKDPIKTAPEIDVEIATVGGIAQGLTFGGDDGNGLMPLVDAVTVLIDPTTGELTAPGTGGGSGAAIRGLYKSGFGIQITDPDPPTGVTLALATGTDLGIGLYDYVFTKRTITHKESGPSAPLSITTTTGNQDVTVTLPALDPVNDPLTIGYSIYRSAVGGTGTPISQCGGVTSTVDGTGKTTYQYQIPASYLLSYDPSILATPGTPPLPIDPATGLACTFDSGTGLFMSGGSAFDATLPQTYTSGQGYTFVADHGAGAYADTASDASIATNKRPPGDNTPEIDTLLATVDETLDSPLKAGLINTGPSGGLKPLGRGLKINPAVVSGVDISGVRIDAGDDSNGVYVTAGFRCNTVVDCAYSHENTTTLDGLVRSVWLHDYVNLLGISTYYPLQIGTDNPHNDGLAFSDAQVESGTAGDASFNPLVRLSINQNSGGDWPGFTGDLSHLELDGDLYTSGSARIAQGVGSRTGNTPSGSYNPYLDVGGRIQIGTVYNPSTTALSTCNTQFEFNNTVFMDDLFASTVEASTFLNGAGSAVNIGNPVSIISTVPGLVGLTVAVPGGQTANAIEATVGGTDVFHVTPIGDVVATGQVTAPSAHFTGTSTVINDGRTDHKAITAPATPASGYTSLYSKTVSSVTRLFELRDDGTEIEIGAGSGGTVTSVGLTVPSILTVTGSPVTGSGTLALSLATEPANTFLAGPTGGAAATPTNRVIMAPDLPLGSVNVDGTVLEGDLLYHHTPTALTIGFIGDSITADTPTSGNPPPANAASDLSIGGLTVTANNRGVGGTDTADWLPSNGSGPYAAAKAALIAAGASIVHIMLGANDSTTLARTSQAAYQSNVAALCADLNAAGMICVLSYPMYAVPGSISALFDATSDTLLQQYQTAINALVNGTTIRQGDTTAYTYFQAHTSELSDGVHPTATGSVDLARLWANALSPIVTAPLKRLPLGANHTVVQSNGTDPVYGLITNSNIDAAAAITLSKLGQSGATSNQVPTWNGTAWVPADAPSSSGTSGTDHLHGLARWVASGGTTVELPDLAEYIQMVFDNGSAVDETTVTLSADRSQLVFTSAPTAGHVLQAEYVIARI